MNTFEDDKTLRHVGLSLQPRASSDVLVTAMPLEILIGGVTAKEAYVIECTLSTLAL